MKIERKPMAHLENSSEEEEELRLQDSEGSKSVVANRNFADGESIFIFSGPRVKGEEIPPINDEGDDRYVQIGKDLYLGPSGDLDDIFNHSCNPNSGLVITGDQVLLKAIRPIREGEEITWDYSTTMDEEDWTLECHCGSENCRKVIKDFKYLPPEVRQKYIDLKIVPEYNHVFRQ